MAAAQPEGGVQRADDPHGPHAQLRDLAALLALPATWRGRDATFIGGSLLDALVSLLRVDVACLRVDDPTGADPVIECRPLNAMAADSLDDWTDRDGAPGESVQEVPGHGRMRVMRVHARVDRGRAVVVLCSRRPDFPTDVESFLLRTAIDQGMIALEGSRLLRDLKKANEAKATFLATMSHELRTPLNAIMGYVDLLDMEVSGALNERQKHSLARVRAGSVHLQELIEGILNFARIDAGKVHVHHETADLCSLAHDTTTLIEPLARQRGLDLVVRTPEEPLLVTTDPSKVRQILLNLLSNAVKFTREGAVTVDIGTDGNGVVLSVRDTGVGIAPEEQDVIFEPFRQVGDVYTQKSTGTGLGLSVSRQLARLLGGDILLDSAPSRGSVFTVILPNQVQL